jgi:REP element-mobilizing transposase RayT
MVTGYHLIWTGYGHWLPNDVRGSMSCELRCAKFAPLGELHFGRKRIQPAGKLIHEFYDAARGLLKHPLLNFSADQIQKISESFSQVVREREYTCYACAIMPDHVHLLIRKHRDKAEEMIEHFQDASRVAIQAVIGAEHPVWGGPGWKVYLDSLDDMTRTIRYIEQNPIKIGLPIQSWDFVTQYDGWLPGTIRFAKPQAKRKPV